MKIRTTTFFVLALCLSCVKTQSDSVEKVAKTQSTETIAFHEYSDVDTSIADRFDKAKWMVKDDHHYPYRDSLLTGLLNTHQLDSLTKAEVIDLLGKPDRIDNLYLFYRIAQRRLGLWPLHTKTLVIKFSDETNLEWVRIHE